MLSLHASIPPSPSPQSSFYSMGPSYRWTPNRGRWHSSSAHDASVLSSAVCLEAHIRSSLKDLLSSTCFHNATPTSPSAKRAPIGLLQPYHLSYGGLSTSRDQRNLDAVSTSATAAAVAAASISSLPGSWTASASSSLPRRRLIMMRHAESEPVAFNSAGGTTRDHDRCISARGAEEARDVAVQLRDAGWIPEVLIASNATRSRQTLEELRRQIPALEDADAHFLGSLYTVSQLDGQCQSHIANVVATEASLQHTCVLCLGHNKGWEEAASGWAGQHVDLDNCNAALLETEAESWTKAFAEDSVWRLVDVVRPNV